ncbi:DUF6221 family protein [Amycolatopsis sp. NPDC004368]
MDDLIAFLRARLDEDEQAARDSAGVRWVTPVPGSVHVDPAAIRENTLAYGHLGFVVSADVSPQGDAYRRHIARHDPARVLAEVAAKRQIIDAAVRADEAGDAALQTAGEYARAQALSDVLDWLALPFADHPDYREEWRP